MDAESIREALVNINEVREALGETLKSTGLRMNIYAFTPRSIIPPMAIVHPNNNRTINYLEAQSSRAAKWSFTVIIAVGFVHSEAAQRTVGDLITPGSFLLNALNTRIGSGYAQVTDASVMESMFGEGDRKGLYTCARLNVLVLA